MRAGMDADEDLSDNSCTPADPGRATPACRSEPSATAAIEHAGPAIEIDRLTTRSGEALALEDITLTVRRQEIFGLLGPSGAGKTSLLKAVLLLESADGGNIRLFGEPHRASQRALPARPSAAALPAARSPDRARLRAPHARFPRRPDETLPNCRAGRAARAGPGRAATADQGLRQRHGAKARSTGAAFDRPAAARARRADERARPRDAHPVQAGAWGGSSARAHHPSECPDRGRSRPAVRSDRHPAPGPARLCRDAGRAAGAHRRADARERIPGGYPGSLLVETRRSACPTRRRRASTVSYAPPYGE